MSQIRLISQKRSTLKGQLTLLERAVSRDPVDTINIKLRFERLKQLFFAYEELNDELAIDNPDDEGLNQMEEIRDRYYRLAAEITSLTPSTSSANDPTFVNPPMGSSTFIEKQRLLKLPTAELPKFDGHYEKWISFKNAFSTMVNARTDIDDLVKFFYLRDALVGEARNKISIFDTTAENFKSAWKLLVEAYDRKRILVTKHLDALLDIKSLDNANAHELSKLVDDTRQHLNVLKSLGVNLDDPIVVRLLERALPIDVREKWEDSLGLDIFPKLETFYDFINVTAFKRSTMDIEKMRAKGEKGQKRLLERPSEDIKRTKFHPVTRALTLNTPIAKCGYCGNSHRIYSCNTFNKLSHKDRVNFLKTKGWCQNCLHKHSGICKARSCHKCGERHHTSLHQDTQADQGQQ